MEKLFKKMEIFNKKSIQNLLMLTVAGLVNATGISLFLTPMKLYDSGVSGTSMLLERITPMSLSIYLLILNIPLFLFCLKKQGKKFTFYAIYSVAMYSLFASMWSNIYDLSGAIGSPIVGNELLLCAIFGGLISGCGSGIAIRFGGALDGIEVMAIIFAKKFGLTVGTFVMIYNAILYVISAIVTGSWVLPLYSIITYFVGLKTIDFIVEGIDRAKCAMIITEKSEEVCEALCNEFGRGITIMKARGGYSKKDKSMIYFVVNRYQINKLKDIVHNIDLGAYITISEVADVFSNNTKNWRDNSDLQGGTQ